MLGSTPCSGVVAASGVVPCYDETQAQCVMSMPQARQCCSRSVGFAVWEMGDGQYERGDLDSCSGSDAACSSVARATLGRDFVTKIAVSSMKSPIFTAARAHRALARLRLARFPWRSLPKGRLMPAFFSSHRCPDLGPPYPGHMILGLTPSAGAFVGLRGVNGGLQPPARMRSMFCTSQI